MKTKKLLCIILACITCILFALTGCGGNTDNTPTGGDSGGDNGTYYTVTFDSRGGSAVESQSIREGNTARVPSVPTRESYSFIGWFVDITDTAKEWKFSTDRVTADITLYAKWKPDEVQEPTTSLVFERNADGYTVTGASGQEEKIIIPAEHEGLPVTEIGESAFAYSRHTSDITFVSIPDSVTAIGLNAFYSRSELVTVDIGGDSVLTTISNNAFAGNTSLKSITIPQGVTTIGDSAFNNCGSLQGFTVASGNTVYRSENGHLIERATNTLIRGVNNASVPDGVKVVAKAAFRKANGITELNVPKSVTTIGNYFIADSTIAKINYAGTEAEWNAIQKSSTMWNYGNLDVQLVFAGTTQEQPTDEPKVLIAYFSCTNNTKNVAQAIHNQVSNSYLYEITPAIPYTSADLNYNTDCRANREQNDSSSRPAISGSVDDIAQYDVIFIGYPIWWGQAPKIIYTFLESYDFSGKTVIPFCTSGSSPMGTSADNLHGSAPTANWKSGARISGNNVSSLISQMQ
ncbi:MAG: leucine-rich repeat protein [Clostridiales bacterium]|nr:leucine-rich repeat protein [Clostridiales bacterium]